MYLKNGVDYCLVLRSYVLFSKFLYLCFTPSSLSNATYYIPGRLGRSAATTGGAAMGQGQGGADVLITGVSGSCHDGCEV